MIELLCLLDSSDDNILRNILNPENYVDDTAMNPRLNYVRPKDVKNIFEELKKISVSAIETSLGNKSICEIISSTEGYRMDAIAFKNLIVPEFISLFNAFYWGARSNKSMLIFFD